MRITKHTDGRIVCKYTEYDIRLAAHLAGVSNKQLMEFNTVEALTSYNELERRKQNKDELALNNYRLVRGKMSELFISCLIGGCLVLDNPHSSFDLVATGTNSRLLRVDVKSFLKSEKRDWNRAHILSLVNDEEDCIIRVQFDLIEMELSITGVLLKDAACDYVQKLGGTIHPSQVWHSFPDIKVSSVFDINEHIYDIKKSQAYLDNKDLVFEYLSLSQIINILTTILEPDELRPEIVKPNRDVAIVKFNTNKSLGRMITSNCLGYSIPSQLKYELGERASSCYHYNILYYLLNLKNLCQNYLGYVDIKAKVESENIKRKLIKDREELLRYAQQKGMDYSLIKQLQDAD